jgi:putative ABC transport system ATP-binding protein
MAPTVRIRGLQHAFGAGDARKAVLTDIDLDLHPGEIVMMTGPSGSGKTTLLTLIGALRSVQAGSLEVLGQELRVLGPRGLVGMRRSIGFIFQAHNLFEALTAQQNVRMALELSGRRGRAADAAVSDMLTRVGLGSRLHDKPGALSGGQRQRVAVARALVTRPRLVLADEPTAALDKDASREVVGLLRALAREDGATIVLVTHDHRMLDSADRITNLVDGRLVSDVAVQESVRICEFLRECPVFSGLTPSALSDIADKMSREEYPAGATVIRQGEPGDKFYVIRAGSADVIVDDGTTRRTVATLETGRFFGEAALITGEPRNATVVARETLDVYTLGRDAFRAALEASATFKDQLLRVLFQRS